MFNALAKVVYMDVYSARIMKALRYMARVDNGSHSFIRRRHV